VEHPEDQYVVRTEPATLNCKAEGQPTPVITWYRDGLPVVTANENPSSHRMLLPSGQLFFLKVIHNKNSKPDVGTYYCNATNPETDFSVVSRSARLEIAGQLLSHYHSLYTATTPRLAAHLVEHRICDNNNNNYNNTKTYI